MLELNFRNWVTPLISNLDVVWTYLFSFLVGWYFYSKVMLMALSSWKSLSIFLYSTAETISYLSPKGYSIYSVRFTWDFLVR